ncbi:MAG: peroxiredoxin [Culicoidibacterales bacterium]
MLTLHTTAPNFTLLGQDEQLHSLSDYLGQYVILYFYPRDLTAGCTLQAETYQNLQPEFTALNTKIIGISRDTVKRHQRFCEAKGLDFLLLADPEETVCNLYDVMKEKMMYGKQVRGIQRSTFIINPSGELIAINRNVKAKLDPMATLELLKTLQD